MAVHPGDGRTVGRGLQGSVGRGPVGRVDGAGFRGSGIGDGCENGLVNRGSTHRPVSVSRLGFSTQSAQRRGAEYTEKNIAAVESGNKILCALCDPLCTLCVESGLRPVTGGAGRAQVQRRSAPTFRHRHKTGHGTGINRAPPDTIPVPAGRHSLHPPRPGPTRIAFAPARAPLRRRRGNARPPAWTSNAPVQPHPATEVYPVTR
jgi:hypothetical protein